MSPSHRSFAALPGRWIPHDGFPTSAWYGSGASASPPDDVAAHRRHFARARLLVSYAATEAGPIAVHEVGAAETFPDGVVPVGKPLDGVTVFVRDEAGRQMPDEASGELVVRSAYLLPRILGSARADRTGVSDVERDGREAGERDYPTGDLGRSATAASSISGGSATGFRSAGRGSNSRE